MLGTHDERAYNADLGAEPPAESRGTAPGQGAKAERFSALECPKEAAFRPFCEFSELKKTTIIITLRFKPSFCSDS